MDIGQIQFSGKGTDIVDYLIPAVKALPEDCFGNNAGYVQPDQLECRIANPEQEPETINIFPRVNIGITSFRVPDGAGGIETMCNNVSVKFEYQDYKYHLYKSNPTPQRR